MRMLWKIIVTSDLRGKRKLHLGIQMLITARSLEGTNICDPICENPT